MCRKDKPGLNIMKDSSLSLVRNRKQVKALFRSAAACACGNLTSANVLETQPPMLPLNKLDVYHHTIEKVKQATFLLIVHL